MKKNIALLLILVGLIKLADYFVKDSYITGIKENSLIQSFEFTQMNVNGLSISKNGEVMYLTDGLFPIDEKLVYGIFDYLKYIKIENEIPPTDIPKSELENYFKAPFEIELINKNDSLKIIFGSVNSYTSRMLVKIIQNQQERLAFVRDDNSAPQAYSDDTHASLQKYHVLKNLISMDKQKIFKKNFLSEKQLKDINKFIFSNEAKNIFIVDLQNNTTTPAPPIGIKYQDNQIQNLRSFFAGINSEDIFVLDQNHLGVEIAKIEFNIGLETKIKLSLHSGLNQLSGFYVKVSGQQFIYKLRPTDKEIFYLNPSDFWQMAFKLPTLEKRVKIANSLNSKYLTSDDSLLWEWLNLVSTSGIESQEIIEKKDEFRAPKKADFKITIEISHATYSVYYDRANWYIYDPVLMVYFKFEKNQIPISLIAPF